MGTNIEWKRLSEHIRKRAGMYIGRIGNGNREKDGIYILLSVILNNSIDECRKGYGTRIEVDIDEEGMVRVCDYGRGIAFDELHEVVTSDNWNYPRHDETFCKSLGTHAPGHGLAITNSVSDFFEIRSYQNGCVKSLLFEKGVLKEEQMQETGQPDGTVILYILDKEIFRDFQYSEEIVFSLLRRATYLNSGLEIVYNDTTLMSEKGLSDYLEEKKHSPNTYRYPVIHFKDDKLEMAFTHGYVQQVDSFVNGMHTLEGGSHHDAFVKVLAEILAEYFSGDEFKEEDVLHGLIGAVHIRMVRPMLEQGNPWRLGGTLVTQDITMYESMYDFMGNRIRNYLAAHEVVCDAIRHELLAAKKLRLFKESCMKKSVADLVELWNKGVQGCLLTIEEKSVLVDIFRTKGIKTIWLQRSRAVWSGKMIRYDENDNAVHEL